MKHFIFKKFDFLLMHFFKSISSVLFLSFLFSHGELESKLQSRSMTHLTVYLEVKPQEIIWGADKVSTALEKTL